MADCIRALDLLRTGKFGPIERGASRHDVYDALGEPRDFGPVPSRKTAASVWAYGESVCRGHLEFHFLKDRLTIIFADYLPLQRIQFRQLQFDPGPLGGDWQVRPPVGEVLRAASEGPRPVFEPINATSWEAFPAAVIQGTGCIPIRQWAGAQRERAATCLGKFLLGRFVWPSGASLGVGFLHAVTENGGWLRSEDVVISMTIPMDLASGSGGAR